MTASVLVICMVTYECTVIGDKQELCTVWKGGVFHCSSNGHEIELVHCMVLHFRTRPGPMYGECDDGAIVESGPGLRVENNSYTSQLNVTLISDMPEDSIHDDGTDATKGGSSNTRLQVDVLYYSVCYKPHCQLP